MQERRIEVHDSEDGRSKGKASIVSYNVRLHLDPSIDKDDIADRSAFPECSISSSRIQDLQMGSFSDVRQWARYASPFVR
jgi:hypothetical protein